MTLPTDFGPVSALHYNPSYSQTTTESGISVAQIGGALPLLSAQALFEFVNNRAGRRTVHGYTGQVDVITSPYPVIAPFNGYYVFLPGMQFVPYRFSNGTIAADFTLQAAYLGPLAP